MNTRFPRTLLLLALATVLTVGAASPAHAGGKKQSKLKLPKLEMPKIDMDKVMPKVKFKASGKLNKTTARIHLYAQITIAGKTKKLSIFNMGVKKKGKSVRVNRKIGKLKVALKVSWSGARTVTIKGTARYLKFKVPVPTIRVKL